MNIPLSLTDQEIRQIVPDAASIRALKPGGQKSVYRIECPSSPAFVLKVLHLEDLASPDALRRQTLMARAEREFAILRTSTCPTLAKAGPIDLGTLEIAGRHLLFFSEELVDGDDLRQTLKTVGTLPPDEIAQLGRDIGLAIQELWSKDKIHRDVKPENIMRRTGGGFVLLDAGLALDVGGESLSGGYIVGTQLYFSPEQWEYGNRRGLDFRSDLFALGLTMYEVACGVHPFYEPGVDNVASLYRKLLKHTPTPLDKVVGGFPTHLSKAVQTLLRRKPHLRYPSVEKFLAQLQAK